MKKITKKLRRRNYEKANYENYGGSNCITRVDIRNRIIIRLLGLTFNLGENTVLSIVVDGNTADGKTLVPAGVKMGASDVDEVVFNYTAALSKTPTTPAAFTVEVVENSVKIGGDSTYASLVNIEITVPETISTTAAISVKVTLSEPEDQAAYNAVKGKAITFSLSIYAE